MDFSINKNSFPNNSYAQINTTIKKLKNFLKLPLAHRWVCYEWFYSDIDKAIFDTENEFRTKIRRHFPELKTFQLKKEQWRSIRRVIGKPRRHSRVFFQDTRKELNDSRNKVRFLQQDKYSLVSSLEDLPLEIPVAIVVGTSVIARLREPMDGLFEGKVNAVDVINNNFRIIFDRNNFGPRAVDDCDVLTLSTPKMISLNSFQAKFRDLGEHVKHPVRVQTLRTTNVLDKTIPSELLLLMARLNTLIGIKESVINSLRVLNSNSEVMKISEKTPLVDSTKAMHIVCRLKLRHSNQEIHSVITRIEELRPDRRDCSRLVMVEKMMSILTISRDCSGSKVDSERCSRLRNELDLLRDQLDPLNYGLFSSCVEQHFLALFR